MSGRLAGSTPFGDAPEVVQSTVDIEPAATDQDDTNPSLAKDANRGKLPQNELLGGATNRRSSPTTAYKGCTAVASEVTEGADR